MNNKEEKVLKEIINYIINNKRMPTMRYLQKKLSFKSVNSITEYIKSLEKQNYLTRNDEGKIILSSHSISFQTGLKKIKIVNTKNKYAQIFLNKKKKYIGYKMPNNYFKNIGILQNDILIIDINKELKNDDIGLFIIDKKYRVMKYQYYDGFYSLEDNEKIVLNYVKIIGKVIMVEKKL